MLFIFVFPLIGVLGYLIVRGHTLHEHQAQDRAQIEAFRQFTRAPNSAAPQTTSTSSPTSGTAEC